MNANSIPQPSEMQPDEPTNEQPKAIYDPPCPICGNTMIYAGHVVYGSGFQPGPMVLRCIDGGCEGARIVAVSFDSLRTASGRDAGEAGE